jgi:hypothetical protein
VDHLKHDACASGQISGVESGSRPNQPGRQVDSSRVTGDGANGEEDERDGRTGRQWAPGETQAGRSCRKKPQAVKVISIATHRGKARDSGRYE